jgi:RNA 3'-terminal phosphate cyclase (ATP)
VPFSPTYEYFRGVTLPAMARVGIVAYPSLEAAGYSPRGGGEITLEIEPSGLNGFSFEERGPLRSLRAYVITSDLPESVGKRGADRLTALAKQSGLEMSVETSRPHAVSPGAAVTIAAIFENGYGGSQCIGERGKPMEEVAADAFHELIWWLQSTATTDAFVADQLLLPAMFSRAECRYTTSRVTPTLTTSVWVIKQFMPAKITLIGKDGEPGEVTVSP